MLPFELTKDTPYLALSGELWSVFYEYFNRNWPCYKGFLLYHQSFIRMIEYQYNLDDGPNMAAYILQNLQWKTYQITPCRIH